MVVVHMSSRSMALFPITLALFFLLLINLLSMPSFISMIQMKLSTFAWTIKSMLDWTELLCGIFRTCFIVTIIESLSTNKHWSWQETCLRTISARLLFSIFLAQIVATTIFPQYLEKLQQLFQAQEKTFQTAETLFCITKKELWSAYLKFIHFIHPFIMFCYFHMVRWVGIQRSLIMFQE